MSTSTVHELWPAPTPIAPVDARVAVPGSKSVTNRALVLAALADGTSRLRRPLVSRDTTLMVAGLRALGIGITDDGDDLLVDGNPGPLRPVAAAIDLGNAGTVARFLPPLAALATGDVTFDGDARIRERPVAALLTALRDLGADIDDGGRGAFPLTVHGRAGLAGGDVSVDASSSSQFVTALLLAAPRFTDGITVRHVGSPVPSAPHLEMTVAMLRGAGAVVDDSVRDVWRVEPGVLRAQDLVIEPDLSNAAAFAAAALVTGGRVHIRDWPPETTQPGALVPDFFTRMGATCTFEDGGLTVVGPDRLAGFDADLHEAGELTPVLVAVAALAASPSRFTGVGHIRLHETDRLAALAKEFGNLGADVTELDDGLEIRPATLHGGEFATYDDHRLAHAAAIVGLAVPGVLVDNIATTAKTMPDFAQRWSRMVAG
ncbi:MAG: 3-phosphoshikimate 1-carboxyvinyltransferase [Frankiaceae bacterium]|nr:3-phosphoshikimate 1-carboxyvinyltransferase [Frankiaceae bacterium]